MAQTNWCNDCFRAVRHEGIPGGQFRKIGGVDCYVAIPDIDYDRSKTLLFLPDAFGVGLINSQLLADDFARNGFKTIIPDFFEGDPYPLDGFERKVNVSTWRSKHPVENVQMLVNRVIMALKTEGATIFGATAYCFGAQCAIKLAVENSVKAIVLNHPAFLELPHDFQNLRNFSRSPLLINSSPEDEAFPIYKQQIADHELGNGAYIPGYQRMSWENCPHGWTVRGDLDNLWVKRGKEGAFQAKVNFFHKYL